jgi:hypothetical protein
MLFASYLLLLLSLSAGVLNETIRLTNKRVEQEGRTQKNETSREAGKRRAHYLLIANACNGISEISARNLK